MARAEGRATAIEPGLVVRVAQGLRYIVTGIGPATWFGPNQPLPPQAPADVKGRAFDYPVGFNIQTRPRAYEPLGFPELRALADSWDLLRLVIETRKDQLAALEWNIRPRSAAAGRPAAAAGHDAEIATVAGFLECPDREHDWAQWLRALLDDLFVIDAPTLYKRRDRGGRLYALELMDGATIKPIIDASGRRPTPPDPAYQQVLKGIPAVDYAADELIYAPRNLRPHKVYGFSPVEQIVLTVNIALRRQVHQLNYYTDGNVPDAIIGVPASWTTEEIRQFQAYWDALMEGDVAARRHARFVPGEVAKNIHETRQPPLKDQYDEWLARLVAFAFSIPPTPFIAQVNRATAESAHDQALEEGLAPLKKWVKRLIDRIIAIDLGFPAIEFAWEDQREQDPKGAAEIETSYVRAGIKSINEARAGLGLDPVAGGERPMVATGQGYQPIAANEGAAGVGGATSTLVAKYSPDQPRDYHGRWASANAETGPEQYSPDAPKIKHPTAAEREAARIKFDGAVAKLPGVTDKERFVYDEIFRAEGDIVTDERSGTSSGITPDTLARAKEALPELASVREPKDLTIEQRAVIYRWYFDDALRSVGGHVALDAIGDKFTEAAVADTLFRHGPTAGGRAVQEALNDVIDKLPAEKQHELDLDHVAVDGTVGSRTSSALQTLVNNGDGAEFREALSRRRFEPAIQEKVDEAERAKAKQRGMHGKIPLTPEEIRHGAFAPDAGDIVRFRHFRFEAAP